MDANVDERKSAALAAARARPEAGSRRISQFFPAREVLRSRDTLQAGAAARQVPTDNPEHMAVFFLDGELHRKRRAAIAQYFTPKAVRTRHRKVMVDTTERLIADFRSKGEARLDKMSFRLALAVAAEIVGLTETDFDDLAKDIDRALGSAIEPLRKGPMRLWQIARQAMVTLRFNRRHVRPAVEARRSQPREDVISHVLEEGYSSRAILIECMTYGTAGMITTREFIVMCAWHLFEKDDLRQQFLDADEDQQIAILEEILRLEPVAQFLYREATDHFGSDECPFDKGELLALDIRAANIDPAIAGECPMALDPERSKRIGGGTKNSVLSFGDGPHICPGWQVALHETRVFLDALLRVPGIRLSRTPDMSWNNQLMSYELRNAMVSCDPA